MQVSAEDFLSSLEKTPDLAPTLLEGENPYLETELKKLLRAKGVEINEVEIKKTGPEPAQEDLSLGGSLFSSMSLLWVKKISPLSGWEDTAFRVWERIVKRADGQNFSVWVNTPKDKRYKWTDLGIKNKALLEVVHDRRPFWIKRMNEIHKAGLDVKRMQFLLDNEMELLDLDKWVELWALGGDTWAAKAMGFGTSAEKSGLQRVWDGEGNPAYIWVDSVLRADKARSVPLVNHLLTEGEEPLSLLALLSKSVRLLAVLESGSSAEKQPAFLVQKVRQVLSANRRVHPRRGQQLLERCAELDRLLKSSALPARVLLEQL